MIRAAKLADVEQILEIYAPYVRSSTATFEYDVPELPAFTRRFLDITQQFPWLVWEEDGEILGYAYASRPYARAAYSWCAEPTVYLRPEAQGRGIAAGLYRQLEELLLKQGYQVLYALISGENQKSLGFHQKQGYEIRMLLPDCGWKFDRWIGLYWLEKRLKPVEIPDKMPVSWKEL